MRLSDYEASVPRDDATMRLPHPVRVPLADPVLLEGLPKILGPQTWKALKAGFERPSEMTANVGMELTRDPRNERLLRFMQASSRLPGGTEIGHFYGNLAALRHAIAPQPFFRIDDSLCELLLNTDLDDDIPVEVLKAPYPRFYVEFGTRRTVPLTVPNELSGLHVTEGAYVEYGTRQDAGLGFYVVFTGSPLGKKHALDDATHSIFLRQPEGRTLRYAIDESYQNGFEFAARYGMRTAGVDTVEPALAQLNFLAKVLLYLSLPDARQALHPEKTDFLKSVAQLKSTAKVNKAAKRARGLVDFILVSAPPSSGEESSSTGDTRSPRTHWRRGHYRMQPHGPEMRLRKLVFIRPTLVRADLGLGAEAPTYKVT